MEDWCLHQGGAFESQPVREWPDGSETEIHGDDPNRCALTLSTQPGPAVSVVALGPYEEMSAIHRQWPPPGVDVARTHPPVVVQLHQQRHTFAPVNGPWLLGEVRVGRELLLLSHDGERALVFLCDGERLRLCVALRVDELPQCINLDDLVSNDDRPLLEGSAPKPPPVVTVAAMRRAFARILEGPALTVDDLVRAERVRSLCFDAVVRQAQAAAQTPEQRRVVRFVRAFLEALCKLGEDLRGDGTKLLRILKEIDGFGLPRSARDFRAMLKLIARVAPCLFGSQKREDWHLLGYGLGDPRSPLFTALCKQTATGCGLREPAANLPREEPRKVRPTAAAGRQLDLFSEEQRYGPPVDAPGSEPSAPVGAPSVAPPIIAPAAVDAPSSAPASEPAVPATQRVDAPSIEPAAAVIDGPSTESTDRMTDEVEPVASRVGSRIHGVVSGALRAEELKRELLDSLPPNWRGFAEWALGVVEATAVERDPGDDGAVVERSPAEVAAPPNPTPPALVDLASNEPVAVGPVDALSSEPEAAPVDVLSSEPAAPQDGAPPITALPIESEAVGPVDTPPSGCAAAPVDDPPVDPAPNHAPPAPVDLPSSEPVDAAPSDALPIDAPPIESAVAAAVTPSIELAAPSIDPAAAASIVAPSVEPAAAPVETPPIEPAAAPVETPPIEPAAAPSDTPSFGPAAAMPVDAPSAPPVAVSEDALRVKAVAPAAIGESLVEVQPLEVVASPFGVPGILAVEILAGVGIVRRSDPDQVDDDPRPGRRLPAAARPQRSSSSDGSARRSPGAPDAVRRVTSTLGPRGPPELDVGDPSPASRRRGIG